MTEQTPNPNLVPLTVSEALRFLAVNLRATADVGEVSGERGKNFIEAALARVSRQAEQCDRLAALVDSWGPEERTPDAAEVSAEVHAWIAAPEQRPRLTGEGFRFLVMEAAGRSKLRPKCYASPNGDVVRLVDARKLWGSAVAVARSAATAAAEMDPTA